MGSLILVRYAVMITLENPSQTEVTILSNTFIDQYMPEANGEFVKVYICLLRTLSNSVASFEPEKMADSLLCTEKDILRALKYWAKVNLLSLEFTSGKKLSKITLLPPQKKQTAEAEQKQDLTSPPPETTAPRQPAAARPGALTPDRVKELKKNDEIVQLLYIAEQYLGKTLTPTEMQKILYFYDELKFSPDLIEYLIEYCVSRSHKSIRYMETVALSWAQEGISSVQEAKNASSRYAKDYFTILKSLGISNRNPVETETALMDSWLDNYGFSMEIIQEACSRTILQTGQPSFQYTDKILSDWKKKNVRTFDDIQALDAQHKKRRQEKEKPAARSAAAPNRFNNFQQREYNFDEYEKKLLNQ